MQTLSYPSWTADSGYVCRVDTKNGLWGFCPNTVLSATDCGLAGSCFDKRACSKGCGKTDSEDLTTFTCTGITYCSTALLTFGVDQTYSYIACGAKSGTDHYQITPNEETATTTSVESSKSTTASATTEESTATSTQPSRSTTSSTKSETQSKAASDESAAATTSAASGGSSGGSSTNLGAIIGGVLGGLALVCGTAIMAIYLLRKNNNRREGSQAAGQDGLHPAPWVRDEPKQPQELAGWTPQELPGNTHYANGRTHVAELSS